MYLTLVREIHNPINIVSYKNLDAFVSEFYVLNGLFVHTVTNIDP